MNALSWAVLGTLVGIGLPWLLLRVRSPRAPAARRALATAPGKARAPATGIQKALARRFHGISVRPGAKHCGAVQDLAGRRFLPEEAPALPLAACDQATCQCAYAHHRDRREGEDRRSGWGTFGGFSPTVPGGNRRAKQASDRRDR